MYFNGLAKTSVVMMKRLAQGFILLEVVVSVAILAGGLIFVLRSFTGSLKAMTTSQNYMRACLLLEDKMWELEQAARSEGGIVPGEYDGTLLSGNKSFEWHLQVDKLEDINLGEVNLRVSWQEGRGMQDASLITYLRTSGGRIPAAQ